VASRAAGEQRDGELLSVHVRSVDAEGFVGPVQHQVRQQGGDDIDVSRSHDLVEQSLTIVGFERARRADDLVTDPFVFLERHDPLPFPSTQVHAREAGMVGHHREGFRPCPIGCLDHGGSRHPDAQCGSRLPAVEPTESFRRAPLERGEERDQVVSRTAVGCRRRLQQSGALQDRGQQRRPSDPRLHAVQ
jgi:hypothetical protein